MYTFLSLELHTNTLAGYKSIVYLGQNNFVEKGEYLISCISTKKELSKFAKIVELDAVKNSVEDLRESAYDTFLLQKNV